MTTGLCYALPSMRYQLIIFDFDGTLADSFPFFVEVLNSLARRHGFREVTEAEVPALRRSSTHEVMRQLQFPLWKLPLVARHFKSLMNESLHRVPVFPDMAVLIRELAHKKDVRLALVSSNAHENVKAVLGDELVQFFHDVDCGASILGKAPRLRRLLRKHGVPSAKALYIGDQSADAEAAADAGMDFGAVAWGYASIESFPTGLTRHVFHRAGDIHHVLQVQA